VVACGAADAGLTRPEAGVSRGRAQESLRDPLDLSRVRADRSQEWRAHGGGGVPGQAGRARPGEIRNGAERAPDAGRVRAQGHRPRAGRPYRPGRCRHPDEGRRAGRRLLHRGRGLRSRERPSERRRAQLVPVPGAKVGQLITKLPFHWLDEIPAGTYPGQTAAVSTPSLRVAARHHGAHPPGHSPALPRTQHSAVNVSLGSRSCLRLRRGWWRGVRPRADRDGCGPECRVLARERVEPGALIDLPYVHSTEGRPVRATRRVEADRTLRLVEAAFPSVGPEGPGLPPLGPAGTWSIEKRRDRQLGAERAPARPSASGRAAHGAPPAAPVRPVARSQRARRAAWRDPPGRPVRKG
jgi:hypothetical protein